VLDGIEGMEGNGPSAGDRRRGNVIMASGDSFALDIAMAAYMGADPEKVPILRAAIARGLAPPSISGLELRGDRLEAVRSGDWKFPRSRVGLLEHLSGSVPAPVLRRMGSLLVRRPRPDRKRCRLCGECVRNCPQKCIRIVRDELKIDFARCRSCFCCAETCPNRAIGVQEPLLPL